MINVEKCYVITRREGEKGQLLNGEGVYKRNLPWEGDVLCYVLRRMELRPG